MGYVDNPIKAWVVQSVCPISICIYSPDAGADASGSCSCHVVIPGCGAEEPLWSSNVVGKEGGCKVEGRHPVELNLQDG